MSAITKQLLQQRITTDRETLEQKKVIIAIMVLGLFTLMGFFGFYIYGNMVRSDCVHYSNCFKPIAPYSVQANVEATSILFRCGDNSSQRCSARADNLEQAVQFCETYSNICDVFSFDPSKKKVLIHPNNTGYSPLTNTDNNVYYRNAGVTYQNSGADSVKPDTKPATSVTTNTTPVTNFDISKLLPSNNKSQKTGLVN